MNITSAALQESYGQRCQNIAVNSTLLKSLAAGIVAKPIARIADAVFEIFATLGSLAKATYATGTRMTELNNAKKHLVIAALFAMDAVVSPVLNLLYPRIYVDLMEVQTPPAPPIVPTEPTATPEEFQALRDRINELTTEIAQRTAESASTDQESSVTQNLTNQILRLSSELGERETELSNLRNEREEQVRKLEQIIETHRDRFNIEFSDNERLNAESQNQLRAEIADRDAKIEKLIVESPNWEKKMNELASRIAELKSEKKTLKADKTRLEADVTRLEFELTQLDISRADNSFEDNRTQAASSTQADSSAVEEETELSLNDALSGVEENNNMPLSTETQSLFQTVSLFDKTPESQSSSSRVNGMTPQQKLDFERLSNTRTINQTGSDSEESTPPTSSFHNPLSSLNGGDLGSSRARYMGSTPEKTPNRKQRRSHNKLSNIG